MYNFKIRGVLVWITILFIFSSSIYELQAQCDFIEIESITFTPSGNNSGPGITTLYFLTDLSGNIIESSEDNIFNSQLTGLYGIYEVSYLSNAVLYNSEPGNNINEIISEWIAVSDGLIVSVCNPNNLCYVCENEILSFTINGGNNTLPYLNQYAIVNLDGDILNISSSPVFPSLSAGVYGVVALNYNSDYSITGFSVTGNLLNVESQCYDISDAFIFKVCNSTQVNVSDIALCAGETGLLVAVATPNDGNLVSFSWSTGSQSQSIFVTPLTSQNYSVTATNSEGCMTTDDAFVTVNQLPNVNLGSNATVCQGSELTLVAGNQPAYTYVWNIGATTPAITVTVTSNSVYEVTVTDSNLCSGTDQITITTQNCLLCQVYTCPSVCTECDALITFTANGGNMDPGYFTIFALVDDQGMIQNLSTNNQFAVPSEGIWAVFGINYLLSEGINGLSIGQSIFGVNGNCFDISEPIIEKVCLDCYSDCDYFTGSTIQLNSTGGNTSPGYQTKYILTNAIGQILSIDDDTPLYQNLSNGYYFVYGINYYTTGVDNLYTATTISDITGSCFDLSDPYGFQVCLAGSIGDYVWYDTNGNGLQDSGETGMEGVTVTLYDGLGNIKGVTTTSASGYYIFNNLLPMDYYLVFTNPDGTQYLFSPQDRLFNDGLDSDVNSSGQTALLNLAAGKNINNIDAGLYKGECMNGIVWEENTSNPINKVDVYDILDYLLNGIKVDLILDNNPSITTDDVVLKTDYTNAEGVYEFNNIPVGSYFLVLNLPSHLTVVNNDVGGDDENDSDFYLSEETGQYRSHTFEISANNDEECLEDIDGGTDRKTFPSKVLYFDAKWDSKNEVVVLEWSAMDEINLNHYLIEKRSESDKVFEILGEVNAKGGLDLHEYELLDPNVEKGMRYYYRLIPVDNDGHRNQSYPDDVIIPGEKLAIVAFPNPTKSMLNIEISGKQNQEIKIEVIDNVGRKAIRDVIIEKNPNIFERVGLDMSTLPQGNYFIKVISGLDVMVKRIAVIK